MRTVLAASLLLASAAAAVPATAQGTASRPFPGQAQEAAPWSAQPAPRRPVRSAMQDAVSTGTLLRAMPAAGSELYLQGEHGSVERPVYLTAAEALRLRSFQVNFVNAVSVTPEQSRLFVRINDEIVGDLPLNASGQPVTARLQVPAGLLQPGYNSVRFVVSQRHRVDCSTAATWELWTAIEPSATGFVDAQPMPAMVRRLSDLPTLAGGADGATPIRLRLPDGADTRTVDQAMRFLQSVVLLAGIERPIIDTGAEPATGPGLEVAVGTLSTLADLPRSGAVEIEPGLPLSLFTEPGQERPLLMLTARSAAEVERAIAQLETLAKTRRLAGTPAGLRAFANTNGRLVSNHWQARLSDLGVESTSFDGRLYRTSFRLVMPADFYPADYGSAILSLAGGFVRDVQGKSRVVIRVNGAPVAVVPGSALRQLEARTIELPLRAFKSGGNVVTIEGDSGATGQACDGAAGIAPRLLLSGSSKLSFGALARVRRAPNLSATFTHGPSTDGTPVQVTASNTDPRYLGAAMTMIARMTALSQRPVPVTFAFGRPRGGHESGFFVAGRGEAFGVHELADAAPTRSVVDAVQETVLAEAPPQVREAVTAFSEDAEQLLPSGQTMERVSQTLRALEPSRVVNQLAAFGLIRGTDDTRMRQPDAGDLVFLQRAAPAPGATFVDGLLDAGRQPIVLTAVLAPDAGTLVQKLPELTLFNNWHQIHGAETHVGNEMRIVSRSPEETLLGRVEERSLSNTRLVAAGWLSNHPSSYLGALGFAALVLAVLTYVRVRRLGR